MNVDQSFCPIPDQFATYEEWERRNHLDLPNLTVPELQLERERVRLRMITDTKKTHKWLLDRLRAVKAEIHVRG